MLNEMMYRPVVDEKVLEFLRLGQNQLTGDLKELEEAAHEQNVPIIPHETVVFLQFYLSLMAPKNILEIGTAIGFSASLMAKTLPESHVTTIDRNPLMAEKAKANIARFNLEKQITLLEGQAADLLQTLPEKTYDFIFMDSAKAKYVEFLPECLRVLKENGVLMIDDVLQGGTVFDDVLSIPRKNRSIHRKLNELFQVVHEDKNLMSSIIPLGDGVMLLKKK